MAAERASRKDGGRRASLRQARPRPGRSEPGGKKAAAEGEPEESKAAARSGASPMEGRKAGRPAPRLRGPLPSCSAALALPVSRGGAVAAGAGPQTRPALPNAARQSPQARPGGRQVAGRGGRGQSRGAARAPKTVVGRRVGVRGKPEGARRKCVTRGTACRLAGSAPPSRPAGRPRGPRGTGSLPWRDRWRARR